MNGGNPSRVTSPPLTQPSAVVTTRPSTNAVSGEPPSTTWRAITTVPRTAIAPLARSMPAVRMISVCPSARVPTTIDCCSTRDALPAVAKVSVVTEKMTIATTSAASGPSAGVRRARSSPR